jgi:hypothetical protein
MKLILSGSILANWFIVLLSYFFYFNLEQPSHSLRSSRLLPPPLTYAVEVASASPVLINVIFESDISARLLISTFTP